MLSILLLSIFSFRCHSEIGLLKYKIKLPAVLQVQIQSNLTVSSFDHKTKPVHSYKARDESTLSKLESIANCLEEFLQPLSESLDTLVFVECCECKILKRCIDYFLLEESSLEENATRKKLKSLSVHRRHLSDPKVFSTCYRNRIIRLDDAVKKAEKMVLALIEDRALVLTVKEIFSIHHLKVFEWSKENQVLSNYYKLKKGDATPVNVEGSIRVTFELIEAYQYVLAMHKTFEDFDLQKCLTDMTDIVKKVNYVKQTLDADVTTRDARKIVHDIKKVLTTEEIMNNPCFHLFVVISEGHLRKLYAFAQERGYDSIKHGMQTFRQEHQLVTIELLHEVHNEQLLSTLQSAMTIIFPFLNKENSLPELWKYISQIDNLSEAISHLKFANEGAGVIRTWFNKTHVRCSTPL